MRSTRIQFRLLGLGNIKLGLDTKKYGLDIVWIGSGFGMVFSIGIRYGI